MFKLVDDNGTTVTETTEMIDRTRTFYEKLYKKREVLDTPLEEYTILPKLSNTESEELEGTITYEEASYALKNMKNGKSPGTDGFTVELLKFFWKDLGHFVVRSLNDGFNNKKNVYNTKRGCNNMYSKRRQT